MNNSIIVREYARLTTSDVPTSLDQATITKSAFEWIVERSAELRASGVPLVQQEDRLSLRLDNYVGVIETPCGTEIEILPKHIGGAASVDEARHLLTRMIEGALGLPTREFGPASIKTVRAPLGEWGISRFLASVNHVVKRGVRQEYKRIQREERFLRGRLDTARQMRRLPSRQHLFDVEYDVFSVDRPENRLIRSALNSVLTYTRSPPNWRLARELAIYLQEIPPSLAISRDFRDWRADRLMSHYAPVRPWCELILREKNPLAVSGSWRGPSLLFPMDKLFEAYVAACLRRQLQPGCELVAPARSRYFCDHRGEKWFRLEPDFVVSQWGQKWILDAKWKRLDSELSDRRNKYGLSEGDLYQIFAYGERYLSGSGELFLVFPKTLSFAIPLEPFYFSSSLTLWIVPFDLESGALDASGTSLPLRPSLSDAQATAA